MIIVVDVPTVLMVPQVRFTTESIEIPDPATPEQIASAWQTLLNLIGADMASAFDDALTAAKAASDKANAAAKAAFARDQAHLAQAATDAAASAALLATAQANAVTPAQLDAVNAIAAQDGETAGINDGIDPTTTTTVPVDGSGNPVVSSAAHPH